MFDFLKSAGSVLGRDLQEFATTIQRETETVLDPQHATRKYTQATPNMRQLQEDVSTYLQPIPVLGEESIRETATTLQRINTQQILSQCPAVAAAHQRYVPDTVREEDFWHRYIYRVDAMQSASSLERDWEAPVPPAPAPHGDSTEHTAHLPVLVASLQKEVAQLRKENESLRARLSLLEGGKSPEGPMPPTPPPKNPSSMAGGGGESTTDEWASLGEWK